MRPIQLTISAWGPYPGKVTVDFTKFQEGSVFLVTGPTGAGKTTIFDAICFALYGNVSGQNREKTSVRSDFAAPEVDTYVEFTFLHKGNTYTIYRTPKQERPKKRGEGVTTSAETAVLHIEEEAPIATVSEVNRRVEEIMGINYVQFKQIAMIAQGEFLNLLFAKSEDKVKIFRNLFQTQVYDQILMALSQRAKELESRMKEHTNKMDEAIASIDCSEDEEDFRAAITAEHKNYERIIELLGESIHKSEKNAKELKKESAKVEETYLKRQNEITIAKGVNEDFEQLKKVREAIHGLLLQKDEVEAWKDQVIKARQAQQVEAEEKLYLDSRRRLDQWTLNVTATKQTIEKLKVEKVALEEELSHSKELELANVGLRSKIQWLESLLPLFHNLDEQEKKGKEIKQRLDLQLGKEEKLKQALATCKEEKVQLTNRFQTYDTVEKELGDIRESLNQAMIQHEKFRQILLQLRTIQEEEAALAVLQESYLAQETKMNTVKESYEKKERLYRQAAVGLAARFLEDNQPCPVCGSLEHPKKAVVSHEVPDEAEVEAEKKSFEKEQVLYNNIYAKASAKAGALDSKREQYATMTKEVGIYEQPELVKAWNDSKEECNKLHEEKTKLEGKLKQKEDCKKKLTECEEQFEKIEIQLTNVSEEKSKTQRESDENKGFIANIRLQLPAEYPETNVVQKELDLHREKLEAQIHQLDVIQKKKEDFISRKESAEALLRSHEAHQKETSEEVVRTGNRFDEVMTEAGFATKEEYIAAKITPTMLKSKEESIQAYEKKKASFDEQEKQLIARTTGKEMVDLEQMKAAMQEITAKRAECQEKSEAYTATLLCNKKALESLKEKHAKIADISTTYGYVKDLEKAAKGQNNERIVFEHYVLAAYFEDILVAANLRLSVMTNSRYELLKVERVSDLRTTNSLDLEVLDQYTGKRRSVKTLSGGESFKAALSLALGLSDIIQQNAGGIEIDTLFIDEGFGSLDSESLDSALKTLMNLTGQNKLIGIISHVAELKERIENQIIIEKDQTGSRLKVVC